MRWKDRNINEPKLFDSKDLSQDTQEIKFNSEHRMLLEDPELAKKYLEEIENSSNDDSYNEYYEEFENHKKRHRNRNKLIFITVILLIIAVLSVGGSIFMNHISKVAVLEKEAKMYMDKNEYKDAAEAYRKLYEETGEQKYNHSYKFAVKSLENKAQLSEAQNSIDLEDYEGAIELLLTIISNDKEVINEIHKKISVASEGWLYEIRERVSKGQYELALSEINRVINLLPDNEDALDLKDKIIKKSNDLEETSISEEDRKKAIEDKKNRILYDKARSIIGTEQFIMMSRVNVREKPSKDSEIINILEKGDSVYIEDTYIESDSRIWCKITFHSNKQAYITGWISYNTIGTKK